MKTLFNAEEKLKYMKPKSLSNKEKFILWSGIEREISIDAKQETKSKLQAFNISNMLNIFRQKSAFVALLLIVILLGSSFATVAVANSAVPGDFLFPVDVGAERFRLAFAFGDRKDNLRIKFSEERVAEAKQVLALLTDGSNFIFATSTTSPSDTSTTTPNGTATSTPNGTATTTPNGTSTTTPNGTATTTPNGTSTTTPPSSTSTPPSGGTAPAPGNIAKANLALSVALEHLQRTKSDLESEGNTIAAQAIQMMIDELTALAENHVEEIEKLDFKVKESDKKVKIKLKVSTDDLKTKFKFEEKKKDDGTTKIKVEYKDNDSKTKVKVKDDKTKIQIKFDNSKRDKDHDDEDEHDDDHDSRNEKIVICHYDDDHHDGNHHDDDDDHHDSPETKTIKRKDLNKHLRHGDTEGPCESEDPTPDDTTAPVISGLSYTPDLTTSLINWDTDEDADSAVWYATTSPVSISESTLKSRNSSHVISHAMNLTGLNEETDYYFLVVSADSSGNTATSSESMFTTLSSAPPPDTTAPVISAVSTSSITSDSADITWTTDEDADSKAWYGTSTPVAISPDTSTSESATMETSHSLSLSALESETDYYFLVVSTDSSGNAATSTESSFATLASAPPPDTTAPVISGISDSATTTEADITWTTDEDADSVVWYDVSSPVSISSITPKSRDATLKTSHSETLSSLSSGTMYYYIVTSTDASGNAATSTESSFTTVAVPTPDTTPPVISSLSSSNVATTTADVSWTTDEDADSKVWYSTTSPVPIDPATSKDSSGTLTTSHLFNLSSLTGSSTYYFIGVSADSSGNTATSSESSFTTL